MQPSAGSIGIQPAGGLLEDSAQANPERPAPSPDHITVGVNSESPLEPEEPEAPAHAAVPVSRGWLEKVSIVLQGLFGSGNGGQTEPLTGKTGVETMGEGMQEAPPENSARDFNPLPPEASSESSKEIFWDIGQRLRKRREMLSLTQEEVERHIKVRASFLNALEHGILDDLPSPVQTRGMLANYAGFLDLDVDAILLRFAEGLQAQHRERYPEPVKRKKEPMTINTSLPPFRSFVAGDLLFGGGMVIMLVLFAIWGVSRIFAVRSQASPQATAPSISEVLEGTPLPTLPGEVTLIPAEDTLLAPTLETPTEAPTLPADINVELNIEAVERTYLRVTVDGKVQFDGRTIPGTAYPFEAGQQIDVLVGNAAGLRITYNGRDLGLMGNFGEVIDRVYTAEGVATPTFTPAPTATATSKVTATPSPTPTEEPTSTGTPTPGE